MLHHCRKPLSVAIPLLMCGSVAFPASAIAQQAKTHSQNLEEVVVRALGLREPDSRIASPYSIVDGDALLRSGAATLGEALDREPGVHADTFGSGSSRPVIRGQTAPRVAVLSDGTSILDASAISPDHAVTVDPMLVRRVEIVRGPATLLYGSAAIGGIVNVIDHRVPETQVDGIEGQLVLRGNTVAGEQALAAEIDAALSQSLSAHIEGSFRDSGSYDSAVDGFKDIDGTQSESQNLSAGLSWVGERGFLGVAYSHREDEYGLPGHNHEYEACHPHGSSLHCGSHDNHDHGEHDHDHEDHDHHAPLVDLRSQRFDLRGELNDPIPGFDKLRLRASHTDYRHHEIEDDVVLTTFANEGYDLRLELQHRAIGDWYGLVGMQYSDAESSADGVEAFMPTVSSERLAVFAVEHFEPSDRWHLELGGRIEQQTLTPLNDQRGRPEINETAYSISLASVWALNSQQTFTASISSSQRLPHEQELFARGLHLATNTYECGLLPSALTCGGEVNDADYKLEQSTNIETSIQGQTSAFDYRFGVFYNNISDYTYADTLDQIDAFRLIKYTQGDATFWGAEAELTLPAGDHWRLGIFGDMVRASLDEGGDLPHISPARFGARFDADYGQWLWEGEVIRVNEQHRVASYEETTPAYTLVNIGVSYQRSADARISWFARANNLLDDEVWNHTSFLASSVPLPGRNLTVGMKLSF